MKPILFLMLFLISFNSNAMTFREAKKTLKDVYKDYPNTFYCDCKIKWKSKNKLEPNLASCNYKNRKKGNLVRANRIEFEHVVPAWEFGHQRQCWQKGKRKYCSKNDLVFQKMEGDLHNLVPAVGEVNGDRSNYRYGMIAGEKRVYGACNAEVDFKRRVFEPADHIQGDIARIYFYFSDRYGLKISKKQRQLFNAWSKQDPVDSTECRLEKAKAKIQGNTNPHVRKHCN